MNIVLRHLLRMTGLVLVLVATALNASAQVTVNTVIVAFKGGQRPVQTVMVGNNSEHPAYVTARVEKVLNPESGGDKAETSEDVLISPKSFSIEPRGQRAVRLLVRQGASEKEGVYRALFVPQDRGFGQEIKKEVQGRKASIRVITGMGVLMFVEPKDPVKDFHWNRTESEIVFTNNGNVHVELAEGKNCDAAGEHCANLDGKRVYAGTSYTVKVPGSNKVTFLSRLGATSEFAQITIDPAKQES